MSLLLRAMGFALVVVLSAAFASAQGQAPAAPIEPAGLVGLTRDDVIVLRGKPSGERARADGSVVMVYPDGAKIELREGRVVAVTGLGGAEIVGADGTRYVPGADGNIQRPVVVSEAPAAADVAEGVSPATEVVASESAAATVPEDATVDEDMEAPAAPGAAIEKAVEEMEDFEEEPPPSLAKRLLVLGIEIGLRFGFVLLVLRLSIHVVGVPFFWPDLLKVSVLYLAVREVMHGLGELEGWWEFIPLFRLDDGVSFVVLACSLTWFKIAGSGLTALKIAAMTKVVVIGLMMAVGLAVTFGLSAMQ